MNLDKADVLILTQPLISNYGGVLQNYALQKILASMGYTSTTACFYTNKKRKKGIKECYREIVSFVKRFILIFFAGRKDISLRHNHKTVVLHCDDITDFINLNINTRKICMDDKSSLKKLADEYRSYLVGSDQVWRPKYNNDIELMYFNFLEFSQKPRFSYSASFGTSEWEYTPQLEHKCKSLIGKFNGISVREASAVNLCKEHFGVDAIVHVDPAMLLTKDEYMGLLSKSDVLNTFEAKKDSSLLVYFLDKDDEKVAFAKNISDDKRLYMNDVSPVSQEGTDVNKYYVSVEQWLRGFYEADYVVTDSFHGCVFSLIFNKPFVAIGNEERGFDRFKTLLDKYGVSNRLVMKNNINNKECLLEIEKQTIDWTGINNLMSVFRKESIAYLKNNLE